MDKCHVSDCNVMADAGPAGIRDVNNRAVLNVGSRTDHNLLTVRAKNGIILDIYILTEFYILRIAYLNAICDKHTVIVESQFFYFLIIHIT